MQDTVEVGGGKKKRGRKPKVGVDAEATARAVQKAEAEMGDMESLVQHFEENPPAVAASKEQLRAVGWDGEIQKEPEPAKRKIAVLGSAVSSVGLAPLHDPSWEIWACSPANRGLPKVDVWFELHNPEVKIREGLTEWLQWLKTKPIVYMQKAYEDYPGAREFPLQQIIQKWGPFWWTSQLSFMLALAIEQTPHTIGVYGVDMAANSEYNQQRLACQYFIQHIIRDSNIELVVPPESDILEPAPLYGYCESSRRWRKYAARKAELVGRTTQLKAEAEQKLSEASHLVGALDDMEYHLAHWANTTDFRS